MDIKRGRQFFGVTMAPDLILRLNSVRRLATIGTLAIAALILLAIVVSPSQMADVFLATVKLITPTNPTEFWGVITGLTALGMLVLTVLLLLVAVRGLRSLSLTRVGLEIQAKRDGIAAAISGTRLMRVELIPLHSAIIDEMAVQKIPPFVTDFSEVEFENVSHEELHRAYKWWGEAVTQDLRRKITAALNLAEEWSMPFVRQTTDTKDGPLADPAVAYGPCSPLLVYFVVQLYAPILYYRSIPTAGNYPNLVALFKVWTERMHSEQTGKEREALVTRLKELQTKGVGEVSSHWDPLGTKLDF